MKSKLCFDEFPESVPGCRYPEDVWIPRKSMLRVRASPIIRDHDFVKRRLPLAPARVALQVLHHLVKTMDCSCPIPPLKPNSVTTNRTFMQLSGQHAPGACLARRLAS